MLSRIKQIKKRLLKIPKELKNLERDYQLAESDITPDDPTNVSRIARNHMSRLSKKISDLKHERKKLHDEAMGK